MAALSAPWGLKDLHTLGGVNVLLFGLIFGMLSRAMSVFGSHIIGSAKQIPQV